MKLKAFFVFLVSITVLLIGLLSALTSINSENNKSILGVSDEVFNRKVLTIGINPEEDGETLVEKFFGNATDIENMTFNNTIDAFSRLSNNKIQYVRTHHINIDSFPQLPNGEPVFNMDTYAPCAGGATPEEGAYCDERKWQFSYSKFFDDYNICQIADIYDVDEIWMLTPPFIGKWESLMVGPTDSYLINGENEINTNCSRIFMVMGPTYDRPENLMHNFAHRIESNLIYIFSNIDSEESNLYWRRFLGFEGQTLGCGNGHFPKNNRYEYDYSNVEPTVSICPDWANFPNFTGETANVGCDVWGCNDPGWQEYWFSFLPSNEGKTLLHNTKGGLVSIENNWWKYFLDPYESIAFVEYSEDADEDGICVEFIYSEWSSCSEGTQSRSIVSSQPYGCTNGSPEVTRSCIVPPVSYKNKGDFNSDKVVNLSDLSILSSYWNQNSTVADANEDGVVNISDLSILASNWLKSF